MQNIPTFVSASKSPSSSTGFANLFIRKCLEKKLPYRHKIIPYDTRIQYFMSFCCKAMLLVCSLPLQCSQPAAAQDQKVRFPLLSFLTNNVFRIPLLDPRFAFNLTLQNAKADKVSLEVYDWGEPAVSYR